MTRPCLLPRQSGPATALGNVQSQGFRHEFRMSVWRASLKRHPTAPALGQLLSRTGRAPFKPFVGRELRRAPTDRRRQTRSRQKQFRFEILAAYAAVDLNNALLKAELAITLSHRHKHSRVLHLCVKPRVYPAIAGPNDQAPAILKTASAFNDHPPSADDDSCHPSRSSYSKSPACCRAAWAARSMAKPPGSVTGSSARR